MMRVAIKLSFAAFTGLLSILYAADQASAAEKLGACYKCSLRGSNQYFFQWNGQSTFLQTERGRSGLASIACDDPQAKSFKRASAHFCEATGEPLQWPDASEPFERCRTDEADHSVWIGGANRDKLVLSTGGLAEGALVSLPDTGNYRCGIDVLSGGKFTVVRHGKEGAETTVYINRSERISRGKFGIFYEYAFGKFATEHGVVINGNVVSGVSETGDRIDAIGLQKNHSISKFNSMLRERFHTEIVKLGANDIGFYYGQNGALKGRVCFNGGGINWRIKQGGSRHDFPENCD